MRLVCIVEGYGEVDALPLLIRRVAAELDSHLQLDIPRPIRAARNQLVLEGELERYVELAARQTRPDDGILILLDSDDDAACELGPTLLARAVACRGDRRIRVVLAVREFEAWFLAAAASLAGLRGLPADLARPPNPEGVRDAKGWLSERLRPRSYHGTIDQPALVVAMDIQEARQAPSFDKFCRDVRALLRI